MGTRAALNVAYSAWAERLTPEGVAELDEALRFPAEVIADSRRERLEAAREVPVDA